MNIIKITLSMLTVCLLAAFTSAENRALYLDGEGRVSIPSADELHPPNAITVEAWILPTTARTNHWRIVCKEDGKHYYSDRSYNITIYTNKSPGVHNQIGAHLFLDNNGTPSWARVFNDDDINPPMLQWIHMAATFDNNEGVFKLYRNGDFVGSTNKAGQAGGHFDLKGQTLRPSTEPLRFGRLYPSKTCIDEIRIWNRALTQEEIQSQMLFSLQGNEPGLVGYWNFNDGTADDLTAYANHGAFEGTATTIPINIPGFNVTPVAPADVSATDGEYTDKVRITWASVLNAASYQVWRHTANNSGSAKELSTGIRGTSYDDTTAVAGTTYYYWVKAVNPGGVSAFSASASGYRLAAPSAPTGVSATSGTYTDKVRVTWNSAAGATSYEVWRHTSDSSGSATELVSGVTGTSYDDTTAVAGTTYYYWIKAVNAAGVSAFSVSVSGYRLAEPSAPAAVSATSGTYTDKVRVTWNDAATAASYEVWRHTSDSSGSATELTTGITGTSYDDTTAVAGTTYYYWVKAVNAAGTSAFSAGDIGYLGVVGPLISVNGMVGDQVRVSSTTPLTVRVEVMHLPSAYIGHDVDWWVVAYEHNGGFWYYLNNQMMFTPFDGNFGNCRPAYQGPFNNLPQYKVAEGFTLRPGTYNIWFAVDYPMDGILDIYGQILWSRVTLVVE